MCLSDLADQAARQAFLTPSVRRRIEAQGALVVGNGAAEFACWVTQDVLRWRDVVRYADAKPEKPFFKDHFYAQQPRPFSPAIETKTGGFGPWHL